MQVTAIFAYNSLHIFLYGKETSIFYVEIVVCTSAVHVMPEEKTMRDKKSRQFSYKICRFNENTTNTLQQLLTQAIELRRKPKDRFLISTQDEGTNRVISAGRLFEGMICGMFFVWADGQVQPVLEINDGEELKLRPMLPVAENEQIVNSILYFGILENHVILVQSQSLRAKQLEDYLTWFLKNNCGLLSENNSIILSDRTPIVSSETIKNAKALTFSAPVHFTEEIITREETEETPTTENEEATKKIDTKGRKQETEAHTTRVKPFGRAWEVIKTFFGEANLVKSLKPEQTFDKKILELELSLKFQRSHKDDPVELLDCIANNFRHVEDEVDYKIETHSGESLTKESFKISTNRQVLYKEGLPDEINIYLHMKAWLNTLLQKE